MGVRRFPDNRDKLPQLLLAPANPVDGQTFFNTADRRLWIWDANNARWTFADRRRHYVTANSGVGPVSAETVVMTLALGAQAVTYRLTVEAQMFASLSVQTDTWQLSMRQTNVSGTLLRRTQKTANGMLTVGDGSWDVPANTAATVVATVARVNGTGTVTTFADGGTNYLVGYSEPRL